MIIKSEQEMIDFGENFAKNLAGKNCIELKGDVGVGKTTFTRGLAKGLGVNEDVTSPSFLISKRYATKNGELVHYDFYRLNEAGLMAEDLDDALSQKGNIVVVEWGGDVENILPEDRIIMNFRLTKDGNREVEW